MTQAPPLAVHPGLSRAFAALSAADVRWCVLRGWESLALPGDDVDLLVASDDLARATSTLEELGYLRLPSWGRGSHRFFVTYDTESSTWIKLDVVTRVAFGIAGTDETNTAAAILGRRIHRDPVVHAHPDDAFWGLLLHCLLDRGQIPPHHAATLTTLAAQATAAAPLAAWIHRRLPRVDPTDAIAAAARGRHDALLRLGRRLRHAAPRDPATRARDAVAWALRRSTKLRRAALERGMTIALIGVDGAGKTSISARLERATPWPVRTVYLGLYGTGPTARRAPRGMAGRLARLWSGYLRGLGHRLRGRHVVYDRFSWDALLTPPGRRTDLRALRRRVLAHAIPAPHLVVLLDAPAGVLHARKAEHDLDTLERQREAYLALARRRPEIVVVDAGQDPDRVVGDVMAALWRRMRRARGRR